MQEARAIGTTQSGRNGPPRLADETLSLVARPPGSDKIGELMFTVADTGIGIPTEQVEQIFSSFTQADCGRDDGQEPVNEGHGDCCRKFQTFFG